MFPTIEIPTLQHSSLSDVVGELERLQALEHQLQARKMDLFAQSEALTHAAVAHEDSGVGIEQALRSAHAEIGAALHMSDMTVGRRVAQSVSITSKYPEVQVALQSGRISFGHASIISDEGLVIQCDEKRELYERAVVEVACAETIGRLRPLAKRLAVQFSDLDLEERHREAVRLRNVRLHDYEDGMAELRVRLPAIEAYAGFDRLTRMGWQIIGARNSLARTSAATSSDSVPEVDEHPENSTGADASKDSLGEDSRSLDEVRTDILIDLLLAGVPSEELSGKGLGAISARVQVTAPKRLLTTPIQRQSTTENTSRFTGGTCTEDSDDDTTQNVAHLTGYGAVSIDKVRELAGHASSWDEASVDPDTGDVLSVNTYRPSAELRRFLRIRDMHCRFPGCRAPVDRCDIDHTVDAARGGATSSDNLAHLCRRHHRLKHHSAWMVQQLPGGVMKWTSPTGRDHYDAPACRAMFREVWEEVSRPRPKRSRRSSATHPSGGTGMKPRRSPRFHATSSERDSSSVDAAAAAGAGAGAASAGAASASAGAGATSSVQGEGSHPF